MSWADQAKAMKEHGAGCGGIFSACGDTWGQIGMEKVSKQEIETIVSNIKSGKREMTIGSKGCIVMNLIQGHSLTGKEKVREGHEDEERHLWHVVLGKSNCVYMAGCCGANERGIVDILENKFKHLNDY